MVTPHPTALWSRSRSPGTIDFPCDDGRLLSVTYCTVKRSLSDLLLRGSVIRRSIKPLEEEPRMPAMLESFDVWATWLGETGNDPAADKALLKTTKGVNWTSAPEPKKPRALRKS